MEKILFVIPLMAISLLASCGGENNPGPTPGTTYTLTFNCTDCKAFDENDKEVTSVDITVASPYTIYHKFYFKGIGRFLTPLKSDISIRKTGTEEIVDYEYANGVISIPIVGNLTITATGVNFTKSLEDASWAEIAMVAATGRANEYFAVGDTKKVRLKNQDFGHTVRIIGFNHDDLADGSGKAGITFEFENVITNDNKTEAQTTIWDGVYPDEGDNFDYRKSVLNTFLNNENDGATSVINMLPSSGDIEHPDLKEVIKPVNKLVGVNESRTIGMKNYKALPFEVGEFPKLFPLAYNEMHDFEGTSEYVTPGEAGDPAAGGGIYKYYEGHGGDTNEDNAYRIKNTADGLGEAMYWTRSPYTHFVDSALWVNSAGEFSTIEEVYNGQRAVAPAFCI